jgi:hypothetical protein
LADTAKTILVFTYSTQNTGHYVASPRHAGNNTFYF